MQKKAIVFVILNYHIYETLLDCVASIQDKIDTTSYAIVVVDNPAGNNVGKRIAEHYVDNDQVDVVCLIENCGFARGNNAGIAYARDKYQPDFIVCLNNDTLLEQRDFYACIKQSYGDGHPAIIGPKVILRNGSIQPLCGKLLTVEEYEYQLEFFKAAVRGDWPKKNPVKEFLLKFRLVRMANGIRHRIVGDASENVRGDTNSVKRDTVLHGCCLIFTPAFFADLDGFNPATFMFREEELLFLALKEHGLHNVYDPRISIRHLEDVSTDAVCSGASAKNHFLAENQVRSLNVLINEMRIFRKRGGKSLVTHPRRIIFDFVPASLSA